METLSLVSGATGFIGGRLVKFFETEGCSFVALSRNHMPGPLFRRAELLEFHSLERACEGVDNVYHCAGYAHSFSSLNGDDSAKHWAINYEGTRNLVEAAGRAGVRRFVFLSSVKAMAEPGDQYADEDFPGQPSTAYGQSKLAAEQAVLDAGSRFGMHVVNLRLAMVYGPGGRGNLERMGRLMRRHIFPPLPETRNHRSLVYVDDVINAMRLVIEDERANGRTYIVTSTDAPSGRELYDVLRSSLNLAPSRWTMPCSILELAARMGDVIETLTRRRVSLDSEVLERLLESSWYSPERIKHEIGWQAKVALEDGLREMFQSEKIF